MGRKGVLCIWQKKNNNIKSALSSDLDRYEKHLDNHPLYDLIMNLCQFLNSPYCLRCITKKLPTLMTATIITRENNIKTNVLLNGAMYAISEIIWPLIRRAQLYDQDILVVKIDFGDTGVYQIDVQFPAKFCCGTADQRMLP
jgi:hypothetical protein